MPPCKCQLMQLEDSEGLVQARYYRLALDIHEASYFLEADALRVYGHPAGFLIALPCFQALVHKSWEQS